MKAKDKDKDKDDSDSAKKSGFRAGLKNLV